MSSSASNSSSLKSSTHKETNEASHTVFPSTDWPKDYGSFVVTSVCNLDDNYAYIIVDKESNEAAFVDPAEPQKLLRALSQQFPSAKLTAVFTTHKHGDHAGGNVKLASQFPTLKIYGGEHDNAPGVNHALSHQSQLKLGSTPVYVVESACHTRGHVLYVVGEQAIFTGDTLFIAGCGKFFEGDANQMYHNLYTLLPSLKQSLAVYCGHEYTVSNLEFASWIEPQNKHILDKLSWARSQRSQRYPTIPSSLKDETTFNPFMRALQPAVIVKVVSTGKINAGEKNGVAVLAALRELKNENAHKSSSL